MGIVNIFTKLIEIFYYICSMKTRIQIIKCLIKGTEKYINGNFYNSECVGLCELSLNLYAKKEVFNVDDYMESLRIIDSLDKQYKPYGKDGYYWDPFRKEPRINALKKTTCHRVGKIT